MQTIDVVKTSTVREEEAPRPKKAEKSGGKRIGYYYVILKSLKQSRKNDVVKCIYIKGLTRFGLCVIKEGSAGDSKDKEGRDIKDRLKWQERLHAELYGKVRMPKLLGSFEENGNYYLVMEYIKGKTLHSLFRKKSMGLREHIQKSSGTAVDFLDYLLQMLNILAAMHRCGMVHRDVTPNNFLVTRWGRVAVIDMELCYSLGEEQPSPPFQLGTTGYMSPAQEAMMQPVAEDDIFAAGAIMFSAFTGISAAKLTRDPYEVIARRVQFLIDDEALANIILKTLHPQPEQRPAIAQITEAVSRFRNDLLHRRPRPVTTKFQYSQDEMLNTLQQGIATLGTPLLCDPEKGWFAESLRTTGEEKLRFNKAWYASLSNGAAGIIYFLAKAKGAGMDVSACTAAIPAGLQLIRERYVDRLENTRPGLYMGADGVAVALATALQSGLPGMNDELAAYIPPLLGKQTSSLGMMHGMAGQGIVNLLCARHTATAWQEERLHTLATRLLERQEKDGSWNFSDNKKKPRFTRGFASGAAGIIFFLMELSQRNDNPAAKQGAVKGLQWLLDKTVTRNGALTWKSSQGKVLGPWLIDGVAGIALLFIRAYKLYRDERYRQTAEMALKPLHTEVVNNSLSQGYGLAGLGEVYLQAFTVFHNEMWHQRAADVMQVLMHLKKDHPDHGPHWLVEREREPVPALMTGHAGVLHFMLRFCKPFARPGFLLLP